MMGPSLCFIVITTMAAVHPASSQTIKDSSDSWMWYGYESVTEFTPSTLTTGSNSANDPDNSDYYTTEKSSDEERLSYQITTEDNPVTVLNHQTMTEDKSTTVLSANNSQTAETMTGTEVPASEETKSKQLQTMLSYTLAPIASAVIVCGVIVVIVCVLKRAKHAPEKSPVKNIYVISRPGQAEDSTKKMSEPFYEGLAFGPFTNQDSQVYDSLDPTYLQDLVKDSCSKTQAATSNPCYEAVREEIS